MSMTLPDLFQTYQKTDRFKNLSPSTKRYYLRAMKLLLDRRWLETKVDGLVIGHPNITHITARQVVRLRDCEQFPRGITNQMLSVLSVTLNYAIELGEADRNPVTGIKKLSLGEIEMWPKSLIHVAMNLRGPERKLFYLCLYTGQRIGDVCRLRYWDIDNINDVPVIKVRQGKTRTEVVIPIAGPLMDVLFDDIRGFVMVSERSSNILVNGKKSISVSGIKSRFHQAMIDLCGSSQPIHGLRKNAACMLAEAGCSEHEIMAITGHKTSAMIRKYTKGANQKLMAVSAIGKLKVYEDGQRP